MSRVLLLCGAISTLVLGAPAPAHADPAGPTDYRTDVVSVEPPADGLQVAVIGGDAFIEFEVLPGTEVEVVGYRGEPFLRFRADGVVEVNGNAPSTYLSEDRYGATAVPEQARADAEPAWRVVATDGAYAWHDHRAHWMNEARPAAGPGDQILEAVIPTIVDGVPTSVTVVSTWVMAPSPAWAIGGVVLGAIGGWWFGRSRRRATALLLAALGVASSAVAFTAYVSLPTEAAPSPVFWLVPLVAVVLSFVRLGKPTADPLFTLMAPALVLMLWAAIRRDWILRALLPTPVPVVDRIVTAMVFAAATVTLLYQAVSVVRPVNRRA